MYTGDEIDHCIEWNLTARRMKRPVIDGWRFRIIRRAVDGRTYWRCSDNACSVTAITDDQHLVSISNQHNHEFREKKFLEGVILIRV